MGDLRQHRLFPQGVNDNAIVITISTLMLYIYYKYIVKCITIDKNIIYAP